MVKALVEIQVSSDGPAILVESTNSEGSIGFIDAASDSGLVLRAERTMTASLSVLRSVADAVIEQLSGTVTKPKSATLELGIKFGAKGNIIVAGGEAEANCKVTLTWDLSGATE